MFRLIKLAMYALVGYVLYELYLGMTQEQGGRSFGGGGEGAFGRGEGGSVGTLTGGGAGTSDTVSDYGGAERRHTVGRGVISGS